MSGIVWQVEARKFDQHRHYILPVTLVHDDGERLHFHTRPGAIVDHRTRGEQIPIRWATDMFFWRGRWYNIFVSHDQAGPVHHYYCNVSLPPVVSGTTLVFVDLDLDVRIYPDGRYEVLDEDEFAAHTVEFGYPTAVQGAARQAVEDILALWRAGGSPFEK